ncbi:MAG: hypothetical protein R3283_04960 [Balneolaceae bacterium]|nr:hypothetical protein [Balneolaceae bacterium]
MRVVLLLLIGFLMLTSSCTTSRWVVTNQYALDENAEPEIVDRSNILVLENEPTPQDPALRYNAYEILQEEYPLRVEMERTVQKYRPRWGFMILGLAGTLFALTAANTGIILGDAGRTQKAILNLTGGVLGVLSFINLQPSGEPIYTGEKELMRRSGIEVLVDSTAIQNSESDRLSLVTISFRDSILFSESNLPLSENGLEINLASLSGELSERVEADSEIDVVLEYSGQEYRKTIRADQFLVPFIRITEPVTTLHSSPDNSEINVITEVGEGSRLQILSMNDGEEQDEEREWLRVRYENTEAFIQNDTGVKEWRPLAGSVSSRVYEFAEIPFGEIDVESGVPVLKDSDPADKALIVTNGTGNRLGTRQYLTRDHDLYRHYSRNAFQVDQSSIFTVRERGGREMLDLNETAGSMFDEGSLYLFLTGFAEVREEPDGDGLEVVLVYENREGDATSISLVDFFREVASLSPESLYLFIDLDFLPNPQHTGSERMLVSLISEASGELLRLLPNSAIIFSNRPGQRSGLYSDPNSENMRHHIFAYYWAEALKQRKSEMSDLVNHLDSNVDYMSRRLHDRPQEIQAFGNLTLDISE